MRWIAFLSLLVSGPPQQALRGRTSEEPVELSAQGGISIDLERNVGIAKGDVVIRRRDVTVCCDEAEAHYEGGNIQEVTCRGRVVIVRPDGTRAAAETAIYRAGEDTVTLTGRARVYAKEAQLSGRRIVYDIGRDRLEVAGKRSRFAFKPATAVPNLRKCPP